MKTIILSHYTVKDTDPVPWKQTWETLADFGGRFAPKLAPMDIKLKLRKVVLEDITQDNLMIGNMVTIQSPELNVKETPIEDLLGLDLDYTPCESCRTTNGSEFPCRTFKDFDGKECQALPEEFFIEATLRVAFKAEHGDQCGCSDCSSCASGCDDEERGLHSEHHCR